MSRLRILIFVGFTALVLLLTVEDIIDESFAGESLFEILDDLALLAAGLFVLTLLVLHLRGQHRSIGQLRAQLAQSRSRLDQIDSRAPELGRQYRDVMQRQFDAWGLSQSEQEVVILLLKGLSFREVASVRQTQDKTVRQQAASVYRKSGLSGRHELAAWFFEDLLGDGLTRGDASE